MSTERYYHGLAAFRKLFSGGFPMLVYHKIGARPARVRLKGLYISQRLFTRQLAELAAAGYATPPLLDALNSIPSPGARIGLTFDDGYARVHGQAMTLLGQYQFRAITFLVAPFLGKMNQWDVDVGEAPELLMDPVQVREWLAAGHEIGSHTLSHVPLTHLNPPQAKKEIGDSKKMLEDQFGLAVDHFCYPYGDWNDRVRNWVEEAGYRTACTTDFGINTPQTHPHTLKRITVRYPTRNIRTLWQWLGRLRGSPFH